MNIDRVTVHKGLSVNADVTRYEWTRAKGYEIVATPVGVVVRRGKDCEVPLARGEAPTLLIPFALVTEPLIVSEEQTKK